METVSVAPQRPVHAKQTTLYTIYMVDDSKFTAVVRLTATMQQAVVSEHHLTIAQWHWPQLVGGPSAHQG